MMGTGAEHLCAGLSALGVRFIFGLPGTQNVVFYEALRKSPIRTVLATSELAASFMAVGYARASGHIGVLTTIPGPGFTYALPGLAEARLDSVPLLHIVVQHPPSPGRRFRHQEIAHLDIVRPLVKEVIEIGSTPEISGALDRAGHVASSGEPGPVVLWISSEALSREGALEEAGDGSDAPGGRGFSGIENPVDSPGLDEGLGDLVGHLSSARRPILFLGLGAVPGADHVRELSERLGAPFFTTPSARGVIPEDHPLCLAFDFDRGGTDVLNEVVAEADLILALGCKLGHNGTGGFRLKLPEDRLVHVNTDSAALGANYPTRLPIQARVEEVVHSLLASLPPEPRPYGWDAKEIAAVRTRIAAIDPGPPAEPSATGVPSQAVKEAIQILREELPRDGIVVTDSGLHQVLVRRHFPVLAPRGLIMPTDFQSMGFGLPAAVGAQLAAPNRRVVAVIGDGGLAMSGMELSTLVREKLPVTVLVFADGFLNLIRLQQERDFGKSHAVCLENPDMEALADAFGVEYFRLDADLRVRLKAALGSSGPSLVELPLGDSAGIRAVRRSARMKSLARSAMGDTLLDRMKKLLGRG